MNSLEQFLTLNPFKLIKENFGEHEEDSWWSNLHIGWKIFIIKIYLFFVITSCIGIFKITPDNTKAVWLIGHIILSCFGGIGIIPIFVLLVFGCFGKSKLVRKN